MRAILILLLAALAACRAQIPDISDIDIEAAMECGQAMLQNEAGLTACSQSSTTQVCSEECKAFWRSVSADCQEYFAKYAPMLNRYWLDEACSGAGFSPSLPSSPEASPEPSPEPSPSPEASAEASPSPDLSPDGPSSPGGVDFTGWASDFECDTSAGFRWVALNASLADMMEGEDLEAGPDVALSSSCQDLNVTGCCTQTPPGNFSWVQYGLDEPMVVQGVRLTAPAGDCCADDACSYGSEPCNERLIGAVVFVSNASIADIKSSPEWKQMVDALALAGTTDDDLADLEGSFVWGQLLANSTSGLCNVVTEYDLFEDGTLDGSMVNNGTVSIGCGLGVWGNGTASFEGMASWGPEAWATLGANVAAKEPQGSWITLTRFDPANPLAYCGFEVCARPVAVQA